MTYKDQEDETIIACQNFLSERKLCSSSLNSWSFLIVCDPNSLIPESFNRKESERINGLSSLTEECVRSYRKSSIKPPPSNKPRLFRGRKLITPHPLP